MRDREILRLADNCDVWIHTLVNYRDQQRLARHDLIVKHVIQLADLPLTCLELECYLRERVPVLDFVVLDPAEHVRALRDAHPAVG